MSPSSSSPIPQRLSIVTLGVADVAKAREFYEALGFKASSFESSGVAFFDMGGTVLGLFPRPELARDAAVPDDGQGAFLNATCAINLPSKAAVDDALAFAESAGARITKPAEEVFWGGYSGYFADPDGHLWEIAFNPVWPLDEHGHLVIPPPAS